jgi:hypothetical protein
MGAVARGRVIAVTPAGAEWLECALGVAWVAGRA